MNEQKNWAKGAYIKEGKFGLTMSIKVDDFKTWISSLEVNEKGYANVYINKNKEITKIGTTHSMVEAQFKPKEASQGDGYASQANHSNPYQKDSSSVDTPPYDNLPF